MTPLFIYLLKVNIALILFYLAYRYGLRRLTFYTLNRFYLLFAIGFSSVYPLINFSGFIKQRQAAGSEIIHYLPDLGSIAAESPLPIWNVLTFVFWSGVVVMGFRFLLQLVSLARLHLASRKPGEGKPGRKKPSGRSGMQHSGWHLAASRSIVRIIKEKINPFSFFRNIYINPLQHPPAERASIIEHEKVHVKEWHTLDVFAGELNRIFYWFNPGAWLMMTAIRENLEFIADQKVLQSGVNPKDYQYSLVKVSEIPYASTLANNFNFAHLKIRITMMDKKRSSELHLVKYLILVPCLAVISLAFNISDQPADEGSQRMNVEQVLPALDTLPADSQVVAWGVFSEVDTADFFRKFFPKPSSRVEWEKSLFVIDGKKIKKKKGESINLDPDDILYLGLLKADGGLALYGEEGKNGVIIIRTNENTDVDTIKGGSVAINGSGKIRIIGSTDSIKMKRGNKPEKDLSPRRIITFLKGKKMQISYDSSKSGGVTYVNGDKALILIDGKESDFKTFQGLTNDEIEGRTIISGKAAASEYGKKGEYGVIKITTREAKE